MEMAGAEAPSECAGMRGHHIGELSRASRIGQRVVPNDFVLGRWSVVSSRKQKPRHLVGRRGY